MMGSWKERRTNLALQVFAQIFERENGRQPEAWECVIAREVIQARLFAAKWAEELEPIHSAAKQARQGVYLILGDGRRDV
jgi:hypothetical protein